MHKHSELLMFKIICPSPKCGKELHEVVGNLAGVASIKCSACGTTISLQDAHHKGAIDHLMDTAAQLDILARKGK